ncbi:MAG: ATP-grasp domain-containing protein [Streptosporangiaceae bacterium]|nr:ATP-grasp domain-containing protein [Streptosporangiaceae bacterium]
MGRTAIIVDPYHIPHQDDRGYASAFRARGVEPIAVLSTPEPLPAFRHRWFPEDFAATHFHDGNMEKLAATVRAYDPVCIVPDREVGVELAAELTEAVLPGTGNVPGSATAQRDKAAMVEALERAGVPHLRTIASDDMDVIAGWLRANDLTGRRIVLKPPKCAGAEDVCVVEPGQDWRPAFSRILGTVNHLLLVNDRVVVQEFAEGTEYIVDLYSVDGRHGLVDACVYRMRSRDGQIGIYDLVDFLDPGDPVVERLAAYTKDAAQACGIRNGCTHAEVMMTKDGPRLIELGARTSGSCMMISGSLATGENHIDRTVKHRVDGEFTDGYQLLRQVRTAWLAADRGGIVRNADILGEIFGLPSVHSASVPDIGATVPMTTGVATSIGWVIFGAPAWDAIEADYRRVRELEGQLVVEPADPVTSPAAEMMG